MTMCVGSSEDYDDGKNHDSDLEIRDYFAGKALQGYLSNPNFVRHSDKTLIQDCYKIADKMMKERDK